MLANGIVNFIAIFFLPGYLIRFSLFDGASINLSDLLLFFCGCWNYFRLASNNPQKTKALFSINKPVAILLGLFLLLLVLSALANLSSPDPIGMIGVLKSNFLLPVFFGFSAALLVNNKLLDSSSLWNGLFVSSGLLGVVGVAYSFLGILTYDGRLKLFFDSPNQLAMLLAVGTFSGLHFLFNQLAGKKSLLQRTLTLLLLSAMFFSLLKSESEGAFVSLAGASLVLLLPKILNSNFQKIWHLLLVLTLVLNFIAIIAIVGASYAKKNIFTDSSSMKSRLAIWNSASLIILDHPFWGVGLGNFQNTYLEYQKYFSPYPEWAVPHAHNTFVDLSATTGVPAAFLLFMTLVLALQKSHFQSKIAAGLIVYFTLHGIVDSPVFFNPLAAVFWMSLMMIIIKNKNQPSARKVGCLEQKVIS